MKAFTAAFARGYAGCRARRRQRRLARRLSERRPDTEPRAVRRSPARSAARVTTAVTAAPIVEAGAMQLAVEHPFVPEKVTAEGHAMGTHLAYAAFTTRTLDVEHVRQAFDAATAEIVRLEKLMTWDPRAKYPGSTPPQGAKRAPCRRRPSTSSGEPPTRARSPKGRSTSRSRASTACGSSTRTSTPDRSRVWKALLPRTSGYRHIHTRCRGAHRLPRPGRDEEDQPRWDREGLRRRSRRRCPRARRVDVVLRPGGR